MRRIDLVCKLLAPALSGVILQFTGPLATTIIVAAWNVVSFFAELGLVWLVYRWVPALAVKKFRKQSTFSTNERRGSSDRSEEVTDVKEEEEEGGREEREEGDLGEGGKLKFEDDDEQANDDDEAQVVFNGGSPAARKKDGSVRSRFSCLLSPLISLVDGWRIYIRQQMALAGIALATIYLTVLGFSGVTATYFLTQGLPNSMIGAAQGIGAIFGVTGTIAYPHIRARIGTVRTGMFGISCQLSMLLLCVVAVLIPAQRISNEAENYFSAHCPASASNDTLPLCEPPTTVTMAPTPTPSPPFSPTPSHTVPSLTPSPTSPLTGSGSGDVLFAMYEREDTGSDRMLTSPTPSPSPTCTTSTPSPESHITWTFDRVIPLALMLGGVILARFGLWIFDLSVQQLVQEMVVEEERGVVGGVLNAMNSIMDMLHYIMVIVAPRPQHFVYLTLISVAMVALGALLYAIYLRKVRGHFFHCHQWLAVCRRRCASEGNGHAQYRRAKLEDEAQSSLINESVDEL